MPKTASLNVEQHTTKVNKAVSSVVYVSEGKVLFIGAKSKSKELQRALNLENVTHLSEVITTANPLIIGHLGNFRVYAQENDKEPVAKFDIIIDSAPNALFDHEVPPYGYYRIDDEQSIETAQAEIPELIGEFEKPRYFTYDAASCAHKRRGLTGCSKCIDACSAVAAIEFGDGIKINPWLCQGCASCSAVCPSGAVQFNWPAMTDIQQQIDAFIDKGFNGFVIVTEETEVLTSIDKSWAVMQLHEVNAIGPDFLSYLIARGIRSIIIEEPSHSKTRAVIIDNNIWLNPISENGADLAIDSIIELVPSHDINERVATAAIDKGDDVLGNFSMPVNAHDTKRAMLRSSISALIADDNAALELPSNAPFGAITVDKNSCTLCLSCVNVCPPMALKDGGEEPKLLFDESACLQCGLCAVSCPEEAISLSPRFNALAQQKPSRVVLHETEKFDCILCGKPFATAEMIRNITEKLTGSTYFKGEAELNRLKMCGDCRVIDLFKNDEQTGAIH